MNKKAYSPFKDQYVFLSASFPHEDRNQKFYDSASPTQITSAITSMSRALLMNGFKIVFGGHPTVSPLILSVARNTQRQLNFKEKQVIIYQSEYFKDIISKHTIALGEEGYGEIKFIKESPLGVQESLRYMRDQMLKEVKFIAGIFIGGMEGIFDEFKLFRERFPRVPVYPITRPGGATKLVLEDLVISYNNKEEIKNQLNHLDLLILDELINSRKYSYLAKIILDDIKKHMRNIRIFVSHSFKDSAVYNKFNDLLKRLEDRPYFSFRSSTIEEDTRIKSKDERMLRDELRARIKWANTVVVLIGKETHARKWVNWEIEEAIRLNKEVIGIFLPDESDIKIPSALEKYRTAILEWNENVILDRIKSIVSTITS